MSAGFLLANNPCSLDGTVGSAAVVGSGAYTIACLVFPNTGNNNMNMVSGRASGSIVRDLFEAGLHLFGPNDFSSGDATTLAQGNWYVAAQTKAAGANTYRHHLWLYDAGGAGVMAHGVSSGSLNQGDGAALDTIRIGNGNVGSNGLVAVVALWASVLTDGQLDTLRSGSLTAWSALAPNELITFENWNGATGWSTRIGTSAQSAINGTVTVGTNPPDFSFDLAATVDLTPVVMTITPVGLTPVAGMVTVNLTPVVMSLTAVPVTPVVGMVTVNLTPVIMVMTPGMVTPVNSDTGVDIGVCLGEPELAWHLDQPELAWSLGQPHLSWALGFVEVDC